MSVAVDELIEKVEMLNASDRAEFVRRLKKDNFTAIEGPAKKNGSKKGYVSPNTIWMRDHSYQYAGMYVAIKDGEFIAAGRTIKEADSAARAKGVIRPLLAYVPRKDEELWGGW